MDYGDDRSRQWANIENVAVFFTELGGLCLFVELSTRFVSLLLSLAVVPLFTSVAPVVMLLSLIWLIFVASQQ